MQRYLFLLAIVLTLAASVFAQPDPNAPANPQPQPGGRRGGMPGAGMNALDNLSPVNLMVLPEGVFVLHSGVLAKFNAETLEPGGVLELFGPLPARPVMPQNPTQQDRAALRDWMQQNAVRLAPSGTLEKDDRLYIVIGNKYFRINAKTLVPEVKADLGGAGNNPRMPVLGGAPQLKLEGGVLFVVLGQELLTVEPDTGKVTKRVLLPKELFPAVQGPAGRGAAGNGRGNRGGGAGGRNGQ